MLNKVLNIAKKFQSTKQSRPSGGQLDNIFQAMYTSFKQLLESNSVLLNIIVDMNDKLKGHKLFGMTYIRSESAQAVFHTMRMVKSLNILTRDKYKELHQVLDDINNKIKLYIDEKRQTKFNDLILPYSKINKEMVDWVGGKNANLGEISSRLDLPVPRGFAITTRGQEVFFQENDIDDEIRKIKMELDPDDLDTVTEASQRIQELIMSSKVPVSLENAIFEAYEQMVSHKEAAGDKPPPIAMRSSAIGEDSELSFAGQYLTFLNVHKDMILVTYKQVIASLYTPRAIIYRLTKGIRDKDNAMSVSCLEMVNSLSSGVMYTKHPFNPLETDIIINAVWGLGPYAVDGTVNPDTYVLSRGEKPELIRKDIVDQEVKLTLLETRDGFVQKGVEPEKRGRPCLTNEQAEQLASFALRIEEHYKTPQDIEWALSPEGGLFILQARPLHFKNRSKEDVSIPKVEGYRVLLESGTPASSGIGHGQVFRVEKDEDLKDFPDHGVLVARSSNPQFVMVMPKAAAILTDAGSVTGHMASLSREYDVPAILGCKNATTILKQGSVVTVDAYSGRVYEGEVKQLIGLEQPRESNMENTPVYQTLKKVAGLITPLNLTDPRAPDFSPHHCKTLHDIARFVHEISYMAMFQISDYVSEHGSCSMKLRGALPIDLHVIDLGGGIEGKASRWNKIDVEQVSSIPFKALLKGILHDELRWNQPRPIEWGGLMSVMTEQIVNPGHNAERFGDKSYAIVSDRYLNFSSRVGYHFAILDSYCGKTINKNYVTFSFKGGAADGVRKNRRVQAIARILEELGFYVQVKADRVFSRFQKDEQEVIEDKLGAMGRLIVFTRQMDMLMVNDQCVELFAKSFMEGDYTLERLFENIRKEKSAPNTQ